MKIVVNRCYGGYSLSPEAVLRLYALGRTDIATPVKEYYSDMDSDSIISYKRAISDWRERKDTVFLTVFSPDEQFVLNSRPDPRNDPLLVRVVEEMGESANGAHASLEIVEIPDGVEWEIDEYDGMEHVAEKHRTW